MLPGMINDADESIISDVDIYFWPSWVLWCQFSFTRTNMGCVEKDCRTSALMATFSPEWLEKGLPRKKTTTFWADVTWSRAGDKQKQVKRVSHAGGMCTKPANAPPPLKNKDINCYDHSHTGLNASSWRTDYLYSKVDAFIHRWHLYK